MIKITIHNDIRIGTDKDSIHGVFFGEKKENSGKIILLYHNAADEKVLLKCDNKEVSMTRYTKPPTTMRFCTDKKTSFHYEGLGALSVLTKKLVINDKNNEVFLTYQLIQNTLKIGDYRMHVFWQEV